MKKTYILTIDSGNPELDLNSAMNAAVGWMSDHTDEMGENTLSIVVTTAEGEHVTAHWFDPDEYQEDCGECAHDRQLLEEGR